MTAAKSYAEMTGLQTTSCKFAAERVGCTPQEMIKFFVDGGEWDCKAGVELEEMLVESWKEQNG